MHQTGTATAILSDAQIVARVQHGDIAAYGALVLRYERMLLAAILPVVRDPHLAQDVVQDVFLAGFLHLPRLRDGAKVGGWLLKVASREAVRVAHRHRRMQCQSQTPDETDERNAGSIADRDRLLCEEQNRRLLDAVRSLPAHERIAISLRYFDGHTVQEVAQITGRTVGTVTKQLSRAIQRLRDQL